MREVCVVPNWKLDMAANIFLFRANKSSENYCRSLRTCDQEKSIRAQRWGHRANTREQKLQDFTVRKKFIDTKKLDQLVNAKRRGRLFENEQTPLNTLRNAWDTDVQTSAFSPYFQLASEQYVLQSWTSGDQWWTYLKTLQLIKTHMCTRNQCATKNSRSGFEHRLQSCMITFGLEYSRLSGSSSLVCRDRRLDQLTDAASIFQ